MLRFFGALAMAILFMGVAKAQADTTVTIRINQKAPYTVTLYRGGESIGSTTGKGSQRVRLKVNSADKVCVKFSGGYVMKAPDGRILVTSCHPMRGRSHIWGHNNIIRR